MRLGWKPTVTRASLACQVVLALGAAACQFAPELEACAVRCGPDRACPVGWRCGDDDYCHRGEEPLCRAVAMGDGFAAGGDGGPGGSAGPDADGQSPPEDGPPVAGPDGPAAADAPSPGSPPDGPAALADRPPLYHPDGPSPSPDAAPDAPAADAFEPPPPPPPAGPSCAGAIKGCGQEGSEDCCARRWIPGGSFNRQNDAEHPATVSGFFLDRFEVTVARFRRFLAAGQGLRSTAPAAGAGAVHNLAGTGWDPSWNERLEPSLQQLQAMMGEETLFGGCTLKAMAGASETRPVNCATWYEAMAFCVWEGGRLPTELEWSFAAAGGPEQRPFPWGETVDETRASIWIDGRCTGDGLPDCDTRDILPVGVRPAGDSRWGAADMGGNLAEWSFDVYSSFLVDPCADCVRSSSGSVRTVVGGSYNRAPVGSYQRDYFPPGERLADVGFRCVRER
jgi:formylglycine-generating enzyme required for sulfatase activity